MPLEYQRAARARTHLLLRNGAMAALYLHCLFLVVFAAMGEALLAWANVLSVGAFAVAARWAARGRIRRALALTWIEVMSHSLLAVWRLGWDSGFHLYVFVLLALMFLRPLDAGQRSGAVAGAAALWAFYVALDATMAGGPPAARHAPQAIAALRYLNVGGTFALLTYFWLHFSGGVRVAERGLLALASTDALSGLGNRRSAEVAMRQAIAYAERTEGAACLILADIDDFKRLNDEHGHEAGDRAIVHLGALLQAACRTSDHVARWGGEEFVVVLPATDLLLARAVAQRIHDALAERPWRQHGAVARLTLTLGVAAYVPGEPLERWVARADAALYRGKLAGKNRTEAATGS